jgi:lipopolysaccharide export system protein LptA
MNKYFILALCLICVTSAQAAPGPAEGDPVTGIYRSDRPISVSSDRLEASDILNQARFVGNVTVHQGDFTLYAREVLVRYLEGKREVDQVEAAGDVRILQGNRVATGDRALLYNRESRVVLSGAAKVHQGQDFIQGDEITVYLNEEKSVVSGQPGSRVNAVIHPKKEEQ